MDNLDILWQRANKKNKTIPAVKALLIREGIPVIRTAEGDDLVDAELVITEELSVSLPLYDSGFSISWNDPIEPDTVCFDEAATAQKLVTKLKEKLSI